MLKMSKSEKKCPNQALGLPLKGSDLLTLSSMVMSSTIMEVIHMYVSIAMKLSKYLTGLLYQELIKANIS